MRCGKRAGAESCPGIGVQLHEANIVRAWGGARVFAAIGRPDTDVGRFARRRSAVGRAQQNVRRDCRDKPAWQLPARPCVVAKKWLQCVDAGWAAGFACRRVITGAGGDDVHGGIVDQPCICDSTRLPRPTRRVPNRGPCIVRGLQPLICDERRGYCRASRGVAISWRLQTDPGDRARATRASAGPAACAIKTMKAGKRASRRMKIRIRAGRWPGTPLLLSLTLAKSSAAIAISRWKRCSNS